jgi:hypothetical protein
LRRGDEAVTQQARRERSGISKHLETSEVVPKNHGFSRALSACLLRLGVASWDDGSGTALSVKFTWFDKNGKAARGGELPVDALPQALDFAIRKGYVSL